MTNEGVSVVAATADVAMDEATANAFSTTLDALAVSEAAAIDKVSLLPIDFERAKVRTLQRQLARCQEESRQLQSTLKQTQADLERQVQQTILIQKKQLIRMRVQNLDEESVLIDDAKALKREGLKHELASTQKNFADELEMAKKREAKISHLQAQLDSLKQCRIQEEISEEKKNDLAIKNLKKQRSELFAVIHKQVRLIDVLRQQRSHVEAATLLSMTENDFLKVVGNR